MLSPQEKLEAINKLTRKSLVDFFRVFLADVSDFSDSPPFHSKISDILLWGKKNFAIEAFRESAKSSLVVYSYPIYCLAYPHRRRSYVVFIKQNQKLAEDKLRQVAQTYLNHPVLSLNLVKVVRSSSSALEVIVKNRMGKEIQVSMCSALCL